MKDGLETSEKAVGGRRGYVFRTPDFYEMSWGQWLKNPEHQELMSFVEGLETHSLDDATAFATLLKTNGFTTCSGSDFDAASVRRLDVSRELLRGNSKPTF
ncbi:hypothetical protein [Anaeromyxobacter dehalogenans]|nr:hypothetical protein [Anaeromyxobacter dehalogenans]